MGVLIKKFSYFQYRHLMGLSLGLDFASRMALKKVASDFSPLDISNLLLWLDGSDVNSMQLRSGQYVEVWEDKSEEGNDFSQSSQSFQPQYQTDVQNGLSSIYFGGLPYVFSSDFMSGETGYTIFMVTSFSNTENSAILSNLGVGTIRITCYRDFSPAQIRCVLVDASSNPLTPTKSMTASAHELATLQFEDNWSILGIGGEGYTETTGTFDSPSFAGSFPPLLGVHRTSAGQFQSFHVGYIDEVIIAEGVTSVSVREATDSYLNAKWGL